MTDALTAMPKYDAYKKSGVKWFGDIPKHWDELPIVTVTSIKSIADKSNEELLSVYLDKGVIKFDEVDAKRTNATSQDLTNYQLVEPGDFVMNNQQAWRGSVGVSKYRGIVSPAYIVLELSAKLSPEYANYLFRDGAMVAQYLINSKGVGTIQRNLYWAHMKRSNVLLPPAGEQTAIAKFLDRKTKLIDQAIAIKEKQIVLLKERKQILIQNAVTRGLDPNVPMKDSGVEWIGEIPEQWDIKRLRLIGQTQNGVSAGADYFGSGYPFISYGDVYKNRELPKSVKGLALSTEEDRKQYAIRKGDVLFTRTSETIEEIGFASACLKNISESTFAGFLIRFRPVKGNLHEGFSKYFFNAPMHRNYFVKEMTLVTRASLSQELLKNLPVLLPPLDEQKIIYMNLEANSARFDMAVSLHLQQIEKLKEYKSTLINSAVTGKIKVA